MKSEKFKREIKSIEVKCREVGEAEDPSPMNEQNIEIMKSEKKLIKRQRKSSEMQRVCDGQNPRLKLCQGFSSPLYPLHKRNKCMRRGKITKKYQKITKNEKIMFKIERIERDEW